MAANTGNVILDRAFDSIVDGAERLIVITDFEGTIFPYGKNGYDDDCRRSVKVLDQIAAIGGMCSIISERESYQVREMVGCPGIVYAGHSGAEAITPWGVTFTHPALENYVEALKRIVPEVEFVTKMNPRMEFEYRTYSIVLRGQVPMNWLSSIELKDGLGIVTREDGHHIMPLLRWDKADYVDWLLGQVGGRANSLVLFFGNDDTDIPVWRYIRKLRYGIGVCIGDSQDEQCIAQYKMANYRRVWPVLAALYSFTKKILAHKVSVRMKRAAANA